MAFCWHDDDEYLEDAFRTVQVKVVSLVTRKTWVAFTVRVDDDTPIILASNGVFKLNDSSSGINGDCVEDVRNCAAVTPKSEDAF